MKTEIISVKGSWTEVMNDCRFTVGKPPLDKEPSLEFKKKLLISEHSPIRSLSFKWMWGNIKSWCATHWVRHKWECFVRTQRSDRTGIPRDKLPQDSLVDFMGEGNVQNLIDTWRKRLCFQASPETRMYAEDFKLALHDVDPEVANVLVPNCVYRCGCPEGADCKFFKLLQRMDDRAASTDIQSRYDAYNAYFYHKNNKEE